MRAARKRAIAKEIFVGGGEIGSLMRSHDWLQTPLGSVEHWSTSLKTALSILLNAPCSMFLVWKCELEAGEEASILFYNDAYFSLLKETHYLIPVGELITDIWKKEWYNIWLDVEQVFATGQPLQRQNEPLPINKDSNSQQHLYTWSYSIIGDETDQIGGVFASGYQVTNSLNSHNLSHPEVLLENDARFRNIANYSPLMIWISAPDGAGVWFNQQWCQFTGQTLEEALGSGWLAALHPDDVGLIEETCLQAQQNHELVQLEYRLRRQDGEYRWVFDSAVPWFDDNGIYLGYVGSIIDITDRKQAEFEKEQLLQELASERARFEAVLRQMPAGVLIADAASRNLILSNEQTNQILRYTYDLTSQLEAYEQKVPFQAYRTNGQPYAGDEYPLVRSLQTGEVVFHEEMELRYDDGSYIFIDVNSSPICDNQGQITSAVTVFQDITERKYADSDRIRTEAALRESEKRLQLALAGAGQGIWDWDIKRQTLTWDERCKEIFGLPPHFVVTYEWHIEALHPDDRQRVKEATAVAIRDHTEFNEEYRTFQPNGTMCWVLARGQGYYDAAGEAYRMSGIVMDITERKQAEAALVKSEERFRQIAEEAERANRLKDEFLAVLSHELRSPLNPILGWAKLLQTRQFDEKGIKRALQTIERNAKLQVQLIEDLLDVSRILRGKMVLNIGPVKLVTVIESALETVRLAAEAKHIQIQTLISPNHLQVSGDAARLQQIVWNLLSNAVKFTPDGGLVEVRLEQIDTYAQIQVKDTGKGINPNFLPYVFDYFRQEDGRTTRKFSGLGLGLAIVRHLTELHGGTVDAESPGEGQGATFVIRLPLMTCGAQSKEEPPFFTTQSIDLQQLRVLVVDDYEDVREVVQVILEHQRAQVIVAASAAEALTVFDRQPPDILISDIGMPEVDGYMLMQKIRSRSPEQGGLVPAIALTAYAGEYDQRKALASGFQKHLPKPVDPEALVNAITTLVKFSGQA